MMAHMAEYQETVFKRKEIQVYNIHSGKQTCEQSSP